MESENSGGFDMDAGLAAVEDGLKSELGGTQDADPAAGSEPKEPVEPAAAAPAKESAKPDPAAAAKDSAKPSETPAAAPAGSPRTEQAPDTWRSGAKSAWNTLAPEIREEIWKREDDIRAGLSQAKESTAVAQEFERILAPYAQILNDYKVNPWSHVSNLLNAHALLMFGTPEQKTQILNDLIATTGLDRSKLAAGDAAPYNPDHQRVLAELTTTKQHVGRLANQMQEARIGELEKQITAFAAAPENKYFWKVVPELQRLLSTNPDLSLQQAYQEAVKLNPETYALEVDRLVQERTAKAAQEAKERAEKARKASAVNVQSRGSGRPASGQGNWEDTLAETLSEIRSRA